MRGLLADDRGFPLMATSFATVLAVGLIVLTQSLLSSLLALAMVPFMLVIAQRPKLIVFLIVAYACIVKALVSSFGMPGILNYGLDALLLYAIMLALASRKAPTARITGRRGNGAYFCILILLILVAVSALHHPQSAVLQIWALRFFFRLFAFFFVCVRLLDKRDLWRFEKFFIVILFTNVVYCSYQFFFLRYMSGDEISGVFGSEAGGNGALNTFNIAITTYYLFGYVYARKDLLPTVAVLTACSYIAAISELKVYYIELLVVIGIILILRKPSPKVVVLTVMTLAGTVFSIVRLGKIYPNFADFFTVDQIAAYATESYSGQDMLGRLTAFGQLDALFMKSPMDAVLGLGIGAGQYSQYFASPLYQAYGETLRWTWFSGASLFLELGYLGLIFYVGFFVSITKFSWSKDRRRRPEGWVFEFSGTMGIMTLFQMVYNASLTVEPSCYLVGFLVAIPYILEKSASKSEENLKHEKPSKTARRSQRKKCL